jgi:hypothetical protein
MESYQIVWAAYTNGKYVLLVICNSVSDGILVRNLRVRQVRRCCPFQRDVANDYIVSEQGARHLLEVNHIPNVTRFPEIWEAYRDYAVQWALNTA